MTQAGWPRITVVTPSYNQGRFLEETIRSVLSQDYINLEYFVLDGGSTDESVSIIRRYASDLDWWVSEKDEGQSEAIARGFRKASGELLAWVNSDDVLFPGCLEEVGRQYASANQPDLLHAWRARITEDSRICKLRPTHTSGRLFRAHGVYFHLAAPVIFYRADTVQRVGGVDSRLQLSMDVDLWTRMHLAGARFHMIRQYLGALRYHDSRKTARDRAASPDVPFRENAETGSILGSAYPGVSRRVRERWRRCWWPAYQMFTLGLARGYIDIVNKRGRHWSEAFPKQERDGSRA